MPTRPTRRPRALARGAVGLAVGALLTVVGAVAPASVGAAASASVSAVAPASVGAAASTSVSSVGPASSVGAAAPASVSAVGAAPSAPPSAPSASDCVLPDDGSMGALDWDTFRRPVGVVRAVMLFVDFPDAPAKGSAEGIYDDLFAKAPGWLAESSYGKLTLQITPLRHWLRMPEPLSAFHPVNGALMADDAKRYLAEAVALADPEVDFSATQIVMIVPNPEAAAYPRSSAGVWNPDEAPIADGHALRAFVTLGSSVYGRGYKVLAHETSHTFGPRDYYNAFGSPTDKYAGAWSLMADPIAGGDHFAFDKWRMGWLSDGQVRCVVGATRSTLVLTPLERPGGLKAVVLRTGLRTAVVAEYRTRTGLDAGECSSGVLIYKVNSALLGGAGPVRVSDAHPHSAHAGTCGGELDDAAYGAGGRWTDTTSGLEVDVLSVGSSARIRVIRTKTYAPPARHDVSIAVGAVVPNPDGTVTLSATLTAPDGFTGCIVGRAVELQEFTFGEWWTVSMTTTDALGSLSASTTPQPGAAYRLLAPQHATLAADCTRSSTNPFALT